MSAIDDGGTATATNAVDDPLADSTCTAGHDRHTCRARLVVRMLRRLLHEIASLGSCGYASGWTWLSGFMPGQPLARSGISE